MKMRKRTMMHRATIVRAALAMVLLALFAGNAWGEDSCDKWDCGNSTPEECLQKAKDEVKKAQAKPIAKETGNKINELDEKQKKDAKIYFDEAMTLQPEVDGLLKDVGSGKPEDVKAKALVLGQKACKTALAQGKFWSLLTPKLREEAQTAAKPEVPTASEKQTFCDASCVSPGAFCIDVSNGQPFCDDKDVKGSYALPRKLREGQVWIVRVVGREGATDKFDLTVGEIKSPDSLFRDGGPQSRGGDAGTPPPPLKVLKEITYTVPSSADVTSVQVVFTSKDHAGASKPYEVAVDHGKYYLDIGLLVPMVPWGKREIVQTTVPGSGGEKRLSLREDYQVSAAVALNIYPLGRRRGLWSAFQQPSWCATLSDLFGLQVGFDIDFKNAFQRIYAGVVVTPIAGLSGSFGVALLQGEFFPPGYGEGTIVPKGETFEANKIYMARPYIGITLSTDILTALSTASTTLKSKF